MIRSCLWLILAILLIAAFPVTASASADITVLSSEAQSQFPGSIVFRLEAEAAAEIVDIDLHYRVVRSSLVPATCRVDAGFTPGQTVSASWTWNMLETGGLPPGTVVEYWWVLEDANGQQTQTSPASVVFDDLRFAWSTLSDGDVNILWYEGSVSFPQELMDTAHEALGRLADDIGVSLEQPVKLYIYASASDLRGALVYPQEWTGGVAFTGYSVIAIGIEPGDMGWGKRATAHELGHMVVHQAVFGPFGDLPTWLDEGLAMDAEGDLRSDLADRFDWAIANDVLFSVRSICSSFPTDTDEAALCYAESYSLVQFLLDHHGREKLLGLLNVFKAGSTYDDALLEVYGFDLDGLNTVWRDSLGLGPQPPPTSNSGNPGLPAHYIALIVVVVILAIVAASLVFLRLVRRSV